MMTIMAGVSGHTTTGTTTSRSGDDALGILKGMFTHDDIAPLRLRNEHLTGPALTHPEDVVAWLGAVQSQDYLGAKWALAQRCKHVTDAQIDQAFNDGKILRTHVMRPTWHFVAPENIRWLQKLTAPRVEQLMAYYNRKLDLDRAFFNKTNAIIAEALSGGNYLTRTELAAVLAKHGIKAAGQRLGHIVMQAELDAVICSGPLKGKQHTYALLTERAPTAKELSHDEALARLSTRYFASHGPAQVNDFAWWSGLAMTDAKRGVELAKLSSQELDGKTYWFAPAQAKATHTSAVHLLSNYDECLIAYKDRDAYFDPSVFANVSHVERDRVIFSHIVTINGRVVGGWRRAIGSKEAHITAEILVDMNDTTTKQLHQVVEAYGRFIGLPTKLTLGKLQWR